MDTQPEPVDASLAEALTRIESRAGSTTTTPPARASVSRRKLTFRPAVRRILPEKDRSPELVDPAVRASLRTLLTSSNPAWPLFLWGRIGCGKTCAALALADRVPGTVYQSVRELHDSILQARDGKLWRQGHESEGMVSVSEWSVWQTVLKAPLVILDELGLRNAGDFELEVLKRVLDRRDGLPTVCLSNHGLDTIGKLYDARVKDRLRGGTVIEYPGVSRRGS